VTGVRRYAVIPTRGDRAGTLGVVIDRIAPQVDQVVVIDNSDDGQAAARLATVGNQFEAVLFIRDPQQPPNLSALWNHGLRVVRQAAAGEPYRVAVLNDDAIVPVAWFETVAYAMHAHGCAAGGFGVTGTVHRTPGATRLDQRLPGYAFILEGAADLMADERFQWWCGDNDLDMQARQAGGTVVLGGDPVRHLFPDKSTAENPVLQARTAVDMRLFVEKWGFRPW